jgi:hypothetical protein
MLVLLGTAVTVAVAVLKILVVFIVALVATVLLMSCSNPSNATVTVLAVTETMPVYDLFRGLTSCWIVIQATLTVATSEAEALGM